LVVPVVFRRFWDVDWRSEPHLSAGLCFRGLRLRQSLRTIRCRDVTRTATKGCDIASGCLRRTLETVLNSVVPELCIWRDASTCGDRSARRAENPKRSVMSLRCSPSLKSNPTMLCIIAEGLNPDQNPVARCRSKRPDSLRCSHNPEKKQKTATTRQTFFAKTQLHPTDKTCSLIPFTPLVISVIRHK